MIFVSAIWQHLIKCETRIVRFERRVTIAFMVEEDRVIILRIFSGGRNWTELMQ